MIGRKAPIPEIPTEELQQSPAELAQEAFEHRVGLASPADFGNILLSTDDLTDRFKNTTWSTYTAVHDSGRTAMATALDTRYFRDSSLIVKDLPDLTNIMKQYDDVSTYSIGAFEAASRSISLSKSAPSLEELVKYSGLRGMRGRVKEAVLKTYAIEGLEPEAQAEYLDSTWLASREIAHVIDTSLTALALQGLHSLHNAPFYKALGLNKDYLRLAKRVNSALEYDGDPAERRSRVEQAYNDVWGTVNMVLRRANFSGSEQEAGRVLLTNLQTRRQQFKQRQAEKEFVIVGSRTLLYGAAEPVQEIKPVVILDEAALAVAAAERAAHDAKIEGLTAEHMDVADEYVQLIQDWRLSNKSLKQLGLNNVIRDMQIGVMTDEWTLPGQPDSAVRRQLSVLARLASLRMASDANTAQDSLHEALIREQSIAQADSDVLQRLAEVTSLQDAVKRIQTVPQELLNDVLALRTDWPLISKVLLRDRAGQQLQMAAESVLFDIEPQPVTDVEVPLAEPQLTPDKDLPESEDLDVARDYDDTELAAVSEQIDLMVFPSDKDSYKTLISDVERAVTKDELPMVERYRMKLLDELRKQEGALLYRTKANTFGTRVPWYVLYLQPTAIRPGIAIVENPIENNATYLIEDEHPGFWQYFVSNFSRDAARQLGATQIIHPLEGETGKLRRHRAQIESHIKRVSAAHTIARIVE